MSGDFLNGLKEGDRVLVCFDDGEVYDAGLTVYADNKVVDLGRCERLDYRERRFSRKTGKQHRGQLVLRPFDEAIHNAHLARQQEIKEKYEEKAARERQESRSTAKKAILAVVGLVDEENLEGLSDNDLRTLRTILDKLGKDYA